MFGRDGQVFRVRGHRFVTGNRGRHAEVSRDVAFGHPDCVAVRVMAAAGPHVLVGTKRTDTAGHLVTLTSSPGRVMKTAILV